MKKTKIPLSTIKKDMLLGHASHLMKKDGYSENEIDNILADCKKVDFDSALEILSKYIH